ncbi:hydrogenase maturation nickel metallochaperone HypA [Halobacteria archaeon AArc-dxtr1]|nr:hydrogenase maturation nickel metallochaperone HypA [Halobacteria archaeon AArc-dxtr1]
MASNSQTVGRSRCLNCGFKADGGSAEWLRLEVPGIGRMTQCPDCGSTNVIAGR